MSERQTWILLRGLARERRHWQDFPEHLAAELGPDVDIVPLELPGNGGLRHLESPLTIGGHVDALREELGREGRRGPFHVLAISMGGMVAVDWMHRFPDEIALAVIVNSSLRGLSPVHHRLRPANLPGVARSLSGTLDAETRERIVLEMTTRLRPDIATLATINAEIARDAPMTRRAVVRQLLAAARFKAPAAPPRPPALVVVSDHDTFVDPRCSVAMAERWGLPIEHHLTAGHDLPLDDGPWLARTVKTFADSRG